MARRVPVTRCRTVSGDDAEAFAAVDAGADALPPGAVAEIPANRPRQAALDALLRRPAEVARDLARVDGVAVVVAGAVGDEGDELAPRADAAVGRELIDERADGLDDGEVGPLVVAADIVGLAVGAFLRDEEERAAWSST